LNFHALVQDLLVQTLCNSTLGYLGVVLLRLSAVHPLLPLLVVAVLLMCLHFVLKLCSAKTMKKLSDSGVHPMAAQPTPQETPSVMEEGPRHTPSVMEEGLRDSPSVMEEGLRDSPSVMEEGYRVTPSVMGPRGVAKSCGDEGEGQIEWSSSSSDSSSWNQILSFWSSKSESSDEWRPSRASQLSSSSGSGGSGEGSDDSSNSSDEEDDDSWAGETGLAERV
jgi:hypothetical protein